MSLEDFVVASDLSSTKKVSFCYHGVQKSTKSTAIAMAANKKFIMAVQLLNFALAANLLLLSNDVNLNPRPVGTQIYDLSYDTSFSSF